MENDAKKQDKEAIEMFNKLKVKYGLPSLEDLDKEFSIGNLEPSNFMLISIIVKMAEKCDFALKIINGIIQPESRLSDMQEAQSLGPKEKQALMDLFKRLSYYEKDFLIVEFDYSEKSAAECIKDFYAQWQNMKPKFIAILKAMQGTWKVATDSKQEYSYFG